MSLQTTYPHLFKQVTWSWGPTQAQFERFDTPPAPDLISNVNLVPYTGEKWVIIRLSDQTWGIPGGTLEPGESYPAAIKRELVEEAGAYLHSFQIFGGWRCRSLADKPYRSHIPHPEYYRLVGLGEVELRHAPLNPADGEIVEEVEAVSLETAIDRFESQDRFDLSELYQLAARLKKHE